jgi:hypothetical protein
MSSDWPAVLSSLRRHHEAGTLTFLGDPTIGNFVQSLTGQERIPLLLAAYRRYRELGPAPEEFCFQHYFESSAHSILISQILSSPLDASEEDVCAILHAAVHFCGHVGDVVAPIRLAEKVFANRPYSPALFDAALTYRATLHGLTATQAKLAKQELDWILWHDPRRTERRCWSRTLQLSLARMEPAETFGWQWMLRHTTHGLNRGRGKAWVMEAARRLKTLGEERYRRRLDEWFVFPSDVPIRLSPAGSNMLRLLVSYGVLVPAVVPVLGRLKSAKWVGRSTADKVLKSLAWVEEQGRP